MTKTALFILFLSIVFLSWSQEKRDFRQEATQFLMFYEQTLQVLGSDNSEEIKKAKKEFRKLVMSPTVWVPNDLNRESNDSLVRLNSYLNTLESDYEHGFEVKLNHKKVEFENLHVDESRNCYRVKISTTKKFVAPVITEKIDTIQGDSIVVVQTYDTTYTKKFTPLTFYLTTKVEFGKYLPLTLDAIQVKGKEPKFSQPLSELTRWWIALEPAWKKKLSIEVKLPEAPSDYFLSRIQAIQKLDLSNVQTKNWSVLEQLKGVRELDLSNLGLDTLAMMKNLTNLRILKVGKNKIRSLHGLENCTKLEYLDFSANEVQDLTPIENCTNLMTLLFHDNKVEDITTVKHFPHLRTLHLSSNDVFDISILKSLRAIKNLDISKNKKIEDITPIAHFVMVEKLDIYNIQAKTLAPLRGMKNLLHLDAGYSQITSLDPIKGLKYLGYLNISGNPIDDFSALNSLDRVRKLYLNSVKIQDISPIMHMDNIRVLSATHTKLPKEAIQRFKKKHPLCEITYY